MAQNIIGLLFEIQADPSKAEAAIKEFEATTGQSLGAATKEFEGTAGAASGAAAGAEEFAGATKRMGGSVEGGTEKVRALEEALGIHIPRAFNRAIGGAEALQAVLPYAFAAGAIIYGTTKLFEFVRGLREARDEAEGLSKDLQKYFATDLEKQLTHEKTIPLQRAANSELTRQVALVERLGQLRREEDAWLYGRRTYEAITEQQRRQEIASIEKDLQAVGVDTELVAKESIRLNEELTAGQENLTRLQKEAADQKKRDDTEASHRAKEAERQHAEAARKEAEQDEQHSEEQYAYFERRRQQQARDREEMQRLVDTVHRLHDEESAFWEKQAADLDKQTGATGRRLAEAGGQQYDKTGLILIQKTATDAVNAHTQALLRQQQVMQQAVTIHNLLNSAVLAGTKGLANQTAGVGAQIAGILQIVGAQRAYAAVMTVVEAAQGFADLEALDFWGAAQAFASSAMFAKVALTSSPGGGGGSSGGSGAGRSQRGGSSSTESAGFAGAGGGSTGAGGGVTVHLYQNAPIYSRLGIDQMVSDLSEAVQAGRGQLIATSTVGIPNPKS